MKKVTVIIPVYNCEKYLRECLLSIINQSYENLEIILIDDHSTDNSEKIYSTFKDDRILKYRLDKNSGPAVARNFALEKATGEYITFQDSDDLSDTHRIENLVAYLDKHTNTGMIGSSVKEITENNEFIRIDHRPSDYRKIIELIKQRSCFCGATIMFRRNVINTVGGYREFFNRIGYEDYDLTMRITENFEVNNLDIPLYIRRIHDNSLSKQPDFRKFGSMEIVKILAEQRRIHGKDELQLGEIEKVNQRLENLISIYINNPSAGWIKYAEGYMYNKLYKKAIASCLNAIKCDPTIISNWRTLAYCIKTIVLHKIK